MTNNVISRLNLELISALCSRLYLLGNRPLLAPRSLAHINDLPLKANCRWS